jgi:prepilin-type N-terminal cleavage/methylation domain-containing protein
MKVCNARGFSLTEVLTAIFLIALTSVVLFASITTGINFLRRIVELRTATLALQEEVCRTRGLPFSDIQSHEGVFTTSSMASLKKATGSINVSPYRGNSEIVKIAFRVDWTAFNNEPQRRTLVTVMTDNGINKK